MEYKITVPDKTDDGVVLDTERVRSPSSPYRDIREDWNKVQGTKNEKPVVP